MNGGSRASVLARPFAWWTSTLFPASILQPECIVPLAAFATSEASAVSSFLLYIVVDITHCFWCFTIRYINAFFYCTGCALSLSIVSLFVTPYSAHLLVSGPSKHMRYRTNSWSLKKPIIRNPECKRLPFRAQSATVHGKKTVNSRLVSCIEKRSFLSHHHYSKSHTGMSVVC